LSPSESPAFAPCGIPPELAAAPPDELEPLPEAEPLEELDVVGEELDVVGEDEGDFDPDAGGELPQPATTRASATSAAPIHARVEPMILLLM
jgi:hypothetical protein